MSEAILVTGGAGYIGSHTCKALCRAGYTPIAFDNLTLGRADAVQWGPLVVGDTRSAEAVSHALSSHNCTSVVHFAARSSVNESIANPELYDDNNVLGLLGVLAGMRATNCSSIVFSSSAAVYGEPEQTPIGEFAETNPISPYGLSKLRGEQILAEYGREYGLSSIALRYFNAAGADPEGELGEFREVETHLIPRALMSIQGWIDDFEVFGSDFPTPDGTAIRDYIHVSDLADAHVLALTQVKARVLSEVFNIGTERGYSVAEVLSAISRTTGAHMATPRGSRRPGDPAVLIADGQLARTSLGFHPVRSDLETIISSAWHWHQKSHPRR